MENNINRSKHREHKTKILDNNIKKTRQFLKEHNDVFFTSADKGNVTVAMNKRDYLKKMSQLLDDQKTYMILKNDPLKKLQNITSTIMNKWNESEYFYRKLHKNQLTQTDTTLPLMYGLPKIHKRDAPMRPIVSGIGGPTHRFASMVSKIISNSIPKAKSYIKNSIDLLDKIKDLDIPDDYVLVSLDVTSLFTNIPLELVIGAVEKRYHYIQAKHGIPLDDLIEAIQFLMENTFFQFNNRFYKQTFGSPMGSPISPIFADMVMADLDTKCLGKLDFKPTFYYRYVDDILTCIPKIKLTQVLDTFNNYHERLQFTSEIEQGNRINFLEITVIRENHKLIWDWYRKETSSGRYIHFESNHPIEQKRAMVYGLTDKCILLAHSKFHRKNLYLMKTLLRKNGYPLRFIEVNMKKRLRTIKKPADRTKEIDSRIPVINLPYIPRWYEETKKNLKNYTIRTVASVRPSLNNIISKGKDRAEHQNTTGVVYRINCDSCSASYVGETKRQLKTRIKEHTYNTKKIDNQCVINEHMIRNTGHNFKFDQTRILDRETNWRKRLISEMIHIQRQENPVNKKEDTQGLNNVYRELIVRTRKKI